MNTMRRILLILSIYFSLTALGYGAFQVMRYHLPITASEMYLYSIGGPALSLMTHIGYLLYGAQSVLLLPWLGLAVYLPFLRTFSVVMFIATWLAIGWWMHDLFGASVSQRATSERAQPHDQPNQAPRRANKIIHT